MEAHLLALRNEQETIPNSSLLTPIDFAQSNAVFDDCNYILSAYVLPEGIEWPSLQDSRANCQEEAGGRRVLFVRGARHGVDAVNATMDLLCKSEDVVWSLSTQPPSARVSSTNGKGWVA